MSVDFPSLIKQAQALIAAETDEIVVMANISALLNEALSDINWVGFYRVKGDTLILGPFQGKVACTPIPFHKGVCGHCATTKETVVVDDVHQFDGHIACDSASRSEIVLPIFMGESLIAILDIDSPKLARFDQKLTVGLENFVQMLNQHFNWIKASHNG